MSPDRLLCEFSLSSGAVTLAIPSRLKKIQTTFSHGGKHVQQFLFENSKACQVVVLDWHLSVFSICSEATTLGRYWGDSEKNYGPMLVYITNVT